jgi:hypothetical protein
MTRRCLPRCSYGISPSSSSRTRVGREMPSSSAASWVVSSAFWGMTVTPCPWAMAVATWTRASRLAELRRWVDTALCQHYGGYELADCWPRHIHAIWELSTLAAEWHRTYGGTRPDLGRALEFYDRWLPGTMRRIADITRTCMPQCVMLRGPGDWAVRPGYR